MIQIQEFQDKQFETQEQVFKALKENKVNLISLKKSTEKKADALSVFYSNETEKTVNNIVTKDENVGENNPDELTVKVVMNTTNFLDSHGDVHIDGIWNKTVKDNPTFLHLQEHNRKFEDIISDDATASLKTISWKSLGYPFAGNTQALIFDSKILKKRNEFMLNQYKNGWVKNHSVGMRYVKMELALNSETDFDKEEKAIWDKYYPTIANKELADERGYFWAITEAKLIEGSAVVFGSNSATPTIEVKQAEKSLENIEPSSDTQNEVQKFIYQN